jgi:cholesterol oxidase
MPEENSLPMAAGLAQNHIEASVQPETVMVVDHRVPDAAGGRDPMPDHFQVIVIGSGFGGSVAAYRLAAGGLRTCLLERGRSYPPGSFARSPREIRGNFWDPSEGLHGLFNVWSFRGIDVVVSSGVGGGSLIYANVLMRMPPTWFKTRIWDGPRDAYEDWPISYDDLEKHYDAVEAMLRPSPYPNQELKDELRKAHQSQTTKADRMAEAARWLGHESELVKLAVTFRSGDAPLRLGLGLPDGQFANYHGAVLRTTCRLCGECNLGCNYGAKNTLDHTYLSAAKAHKLDLRDRREVRHIRKRPGGGFAVSYVEHAEHRQGKPTNTSTLLPVTITCDRLVLAAGALGTPYLLMKNQSSLPYLGPALGHRFSGNGDLLGLAVLGRPRKHPEGGHTPVDASRGPVITTAIKIPDTLDGGDGPGFFIEDAGYPEFVNWMLELIRIPSILRRVTRLVLQRLWGIVDGRPNRDVGADLSRLVGKARLTSESLPLLAMGRDVPDGVMKLTKRRGKQFLDLDWTSKRSREYFDRVGSVMRDVAKALDMEYAELPRFHPRRTVTVHPLGGCPMGHSEDQGVVDGYGQAFRCPGLYVVDGSVMPGPIGANPALTIAAFADRVAGRILEEVQGGRQAERGAAPAVNPRSHGELDGATPERIGSDAR